ncbi:hypothetical protein [Peterkaempfera sp. SMS 1(5)a]
MILALLDAAVEHPARVFFGGLTTGLALIGLGAWLHSLDRKGCS